MSSPKVRHYILEGNIGSGKSSTLDLLQERYPSWSIHKEPIEKWKNWRGRNLLAEFYQDPRGVCMDFQKAVIRSFAEEWELAKETGEIHIWERSPQSSIEIFAKAAHINRHINKAQLDFLGDYNWFVNSEYQKAARKTLYLRTPASVCHKRLLSRDRQEESGRIPPEYLCLLERLHDKVFGSNLDVVVLYNQDGDRLLDDIADEIEGVIKNIHVKG